MHVEFVVKDHYGGNYVLSIAEGSSPKNGLRCHEREKAYLPLRK